MERRHFLKLSAAAALAAPLAAPLAGPAIAQTPVTVRWWYHFDNPQNTPAALVAKFEQENPGIKIQAEAIPWGGGNDYQTRLFAALVAGNAPGRRDGAPVLGRAPRRDEGARAARRDDRRLGRAERHRRTTSGRSTRAPTASNITCRLQYVVLYLYYRQDLFQQAGHRSRRRPSTSSCPRPRR